MKMIRFQSLECFQMCLCLIIAVIETAHQVTVHQFQKTNGCQEQSFNFVQTFNLLSSTCCGRLCAQTEHCQFFRLIRAGADAFRCELNSTEVSTSPVDSASTSSPTTRPVHGLCYKLVRSPSPTTTAVNDLCGFPPSCKDNNWFPYCYEDHTPGLHEGEWVIFIDSNIPSTQTADHMTMGKFKETKMVFNDDAQGLIHAFALNQLLYVKKSFKGGMVYAIEKDNYGFATTPSRIVYTGTWDGDLYTGFIHSNGTSWRSKTRPTQMRFFVQEPSEYSEEHGESTSSIEDIVADLRKGYRIFRKRFGYVLGNDEHVSTFTINEEIDTEDDGNPIVPMQYKQTVKVLPNILQSCLNRIKRPSELPSCDTKEKSKMTIKLSPLWRPVISQPTEVEILILKVTCLMLQGHQFRVAFDAGFFDTDDVLAVGDDVYFVLPQHFVRTDYLYLSNDTVGKRAVISSRGVLSWCSHRFSEGQVLDRGSKAGYSVDEFVDKKARRAILSVFSNGTLAFGSASDVADGAKVGRDVSILIEWLNDDIIRLFTVSMVTIKDLGKPTILVSAESRVSWSLDRQPGPSGKIEINEDCNMEKVLVRSDGDVQVLVYNTEYRKPVQKVKNTRTTWFLH